MASGSFCTNSRSSTGLLDLDNELLWRVFSQFSPSTKLYLVRTSKRFRDIVLQCNEGVKLRAPPSDRPLWTDEQWWKDVDSALKCTRLALDKASAKTKPLIQLDVTGFLLETAASTYQKYELDIEQLQQHLSGSIHLKDLTKLHLREISMQHINLQAFVDTFPKLAHLTLQLVHLPLLCKPHAGSNSAPVVPAVHHNLQQLELLDCIAQVDTTGMQDGQSTASSSSCAVLSLPGLSTLVLRGANMLFRKIADCLNPAMLKSLDISRRYYHTECELLGVSKFKNMESLTVDAITTDKDMEYIFNLPKLQKLHLSLSNLLLDGDYSSRQWHVKTLVFNLDHIGDRSIESLRHLPFNAVPTIRIAGIIHVIVWLPDAQVAEFTNLTQRFGWPERQPGSCMVLVQGTALAAQLLKFVDIIQMTDGGCLPDMQDPLAQAILSESQHRHITYVPSQMSSNGVAQHVRTILPPLCSYKDRMVWGPQPALLTADTAAGRTSNVQLVAEVLDLVLLVTRVHSATAREEAKQQLEACLDGPYETEQLNSNILRLKQATFQWIKQGSMRAVVSILLNCFGIGQLQAIYTEINQQPS